MTIVETAQKHTYECANSKCRARAVIMHKGGDDPNEVFRWNLPPVKPFPSTETEETPHPKGGASSDPSGGRGEGTASDPVWIARAFSDVFRGRKPLDVVNTMIPDGVTIVEVDGKLKLQDERQQEGSDEGERLSVRREQDEETGDVYT